MKKKTDDLERLDGVALPKWAKILGFVLGFIFACAIVYLIQMI